MGTMLASELLECCVLGLTVDLEVDVLVTVCYLASIDAKLVLCVLDFVVVWNNALTWILVVEKLLIELFVDDMLFKVLENFRHWNKGNVLAEKSRTKENKAMRSRNWCACDEIIASDYTNIYTQSGDK